MRNLQTIWLDQTDRPKAHLSDVVGCPVNVQIKLDDASVYSITVAAEDPEKLRALARTFDEAAVQLSAALDVRAARQVNAGAQLDDISARLDATTAAWAAAGHPAEGPEFDAREAAFADLRAWNTRVGAA